MSSLNLEISEDYYIDDEDLDLTPSESDQAFGDDVDTLNSDVKEADDLDTEMDQLLGAARAIQNYGINQTSFELLRVTNLLSGTSFGAIAIESVTNDRFDGPQSTMAVEALMDKVKEKAAAWAAKIVSSIAKAAKGIVSVLSPIWDKITAATKKITSVAWDATKATGRTIKAHPYKTIIIMLAAAAAVFGIITFINTSIPSTVATNGAMSTFMTKLNVMYKNIKWPFGNIKTTAALNGRLVTAEILPAQSTALVTEGTPSALGWTINTIKSVGAQIGKIWKTSSSILSTTWKKLIYPINKITETGAFVSSKAGEFAKDRGAGKATTWMVEKIAASMYYKIVYKLVAVAFNFVRKIVTKTFQVIRDAFNAIAIAMV